MLLISHFKDKAGGRENGKGKHVLAKLVMISPS
jgi:hypothetical protein